MFSNFKSAWRAMLAAGLLASLTAGGGFNVSAQRGEVGRAIPKKIEKSREFAPNAPQTVINGSNAAPITLVTETAPVPFPFSPYPSNINIAGIPAGEVVTDVNVTLTNMNHTFPDDMDILLVAPNGTQTTILSDVGGSLDLINVTLNLDDAAAANLPDATQIVSGTFRPTNIGAGDAFDAPAPVQNTNSTLAVFNNLTPAQATGNWSLYVVDDGSGDVGNINGGWSIQVTTGTPPPPPPYFNFNGTSSVTIPVSPAGVATPYPLSIPVSGLTANVADVNVTFTNFNHTFPEDLTVQLVAPDGTTRSLLMGDAGAGIDIVAQNVTFDDAAATIIPDSTAITTGTYRPFNHSGVDPLPAPAPAAGNVPLNIFNGLTPAQANGTWALYINDEFNNDGGSIGMVTLSILQATPPLVISEFRLRGPGGANDEFVEIHNRLDNPQLIQTTDGSGGYSVVGSDGGLRCSIANGTIIPARGHFLCVGNTYSLAGYATGDAIMSTETADNAGIALFNTLTPANYTLANRIDAAGSTTEANTLYKEGAGYPALTNLGTPGTHYSFVRDECGKGGSSMTGGACPQAGAKKDTNDNAADFFFLDTNAIGIGAGSRLGAPGPENLASPRRNNTGFGAALLDATVGSGSPPNRARDLTSDPANNSTFGTLALRRRFTNNTGAAVTRLRFRIIDVTTFPAPSGFADLRARTSSLVVVSGINDAATCLASNGVATTPCTINVQGTTLETPPAQPNGGGLNSTLAAGTVTLGTPLAAGASINLQFLTGVQQTGNFRFVINIEALP